MNAPQCGRRSRCALAMLAVAGTSVLLLPSSEVWGQGNGASPGNLRRSIEDMVNLLGQAVSNGNRQEVRLVDQALDDLVKALEHQWSHHHHHHHHHHGHFHNGMQQAGNHQRQGENQPPVSTAPTSHQGTGQSGASGTTATPTKLMAKNQAGNTTKTDSPSSFATSPSSASKTTAWADAAGAATKAVHSAITSSGHQLATNAVKSNSAANAIAKNAPGSALANAKKCIQQNAMHALAKTGHNAGAAVGQHKTAPHIAAGKKK